MKIAIFKIFDENDNVIFEGTNKEYNEKFNRKTNLQCNVSSGYKLFRKYRVIKSGELEVKKNPTFRKVTNINYDNEEVRDILYQLNTHGNTVTKKPNKYIDFLKANGIDVSVRKSMNRDYGTYYILERIYK